MTIEDLRNGKVKLKFGDIEQIDIIKREQAKIDAREASNTYKVEWNVWDSGTVYVEAEDEDEAIELAREEIEAEYNFSVEKTATDRVAEVTQTVLDNQLHLMER